MGCNNFLLTHFVTKHVLSSAIHLVYSRGRTLSPVTNKLRYRITYSKRIDIKADLSELSIHQLIVNIRKPPNSHSQ